MKPIAAFYKESRVKTATRLKILVAALRTALDSSIDNLTMAGVAAQCGLTARNIYRYYENRNLLLVEAGYYAFTHVLPEDDAAPDAALSGREQLRWVLRHYYLRQDTKARDVRDFGLVTAKQFMRFLSDFDFFLLGLAQDDPAFVRYTTELAPHINQPLKKHLRGALEKGAGDKTLCLTAAEVPFYIEFVMQSMRSISNQVLLKEHERRSINFSLVEKTAEMILFYLSRGGAAAD